MPTPIGHALAGVAAGCLAAAGFDPPPPRRRGTRAPGRGRPRPGPFRAAAGFALLGMLADVDLLFGIHRGVTHSVGATLVAAGVAGACAPGRRLRAAVAAGAAFGSHVLLDWCGADPGSPAGVMALWPWTREFYLADVQIFPRVCREYWLLDCWLHNGRAAVREILILLPLALAAGLVLRRALGGQGARTGNPG